MEQVKHKLKENNEQHLVVVRGGGDLASGVIYVLKKAGFRVISLEVSEPSSIRRTVSFSECIYDGEVNIEGVSCVLASSIKEAIDISNTDKVAMLVDEHAKSLNELKADVLVDAILAKKNLGTNINMAKRVIALGPGFYASKDCHYVIETMRGHKLGKIYSEGEAIANTGIPGLIAAHSFDRVIHSECKGKLKNIKKISDIVKTGEVIAVIEDEEDCGKEKPVHATIDGVLRGLIRNGFYVPNKGYKIADIDPRINEKENCFSISDKARAIGGAVLLAINL